MGRRSQLVPQAVTTGVSGGGAQLLVAVTWVLQQVEIPSSSVTQKVSS